jgi:FAD/FMN-containing dehydrogenase
MAIASGTATSPAQRHRKEVKGPLMIDAGAIEAEMRRVVRGEVRFDAGSRALYATDGSIYRQVPIGVVIPRDINDVSETVAVYRRHGAPLLSRGGGTSLTGGCCNVAVVIDWSSGTA